MGKTDKTRPWWVKVKDHLVRRPNLQHNDEFMDYRTYEFWAKEMRCGCPMCQDRWGRKQNNKKRRREDRKASREE